MQKLPQCLESHGGSDSQTTSSVGDAAHGCSWESSWPCLVLLCELETESAHRFTSSLALLVHLSWAGLGQKLLVGWFYL